MSSLLSSLASFLKGEKRISSQEFEQAVNQVLLSDTVSDAVKKNIITPEWIKRRTPLQHIDRGIPRIFPSGNLLGTLDREIGNGYLRFWLHIYATNWHTGHIGRTFCDWIDCTTSDCRGYLIGYIEMMVFASRWPTPATTPTKHRRADEYVPCTQIPDIPVTNPCDGFFCDIKPQYLVLRISAMPPQAFRR